ncbi:MAG: hypothetical protein WCK03_03175 [Candidatus Taylorbacteria bacterium]
MYIYDLTIIDFYSKVRRLQGYKVDAPLLWNVNGLPILKMMHSENIDISAKTVDAYVSKNIKLGITLLKEYFINTREQIRDDKIGQRIAQFIDKNCTSYIHTGQIPIVCCQDCKIDFGTDTNILNCKICGLSTKLAIVDTLFQIIRREDIRTKIDKIHFYPEGIKLELLSFNDSMPEEYNLNLTKQREFTLKYKKFDLDPRFIVMLVPSLVSGQYSKRTYSWRCYKEVRLLFIMSFARRFIANEDHKSRCPSRHAWKKDSMARW